MSRPPDTDRTAVIEVENLVTHFGEREILHGISFTVYEGEIMVVMGGSGSGKSTLLRYLLGLARPTSGTIRVLGRDITRLRPREMDALRRRVGVAFQGGALIRSMSVGENVRLPLREHTKLDDNTMRIMSRMKLEVVNLAGFENLMPAELSGGMIKRAAVARAIIMDPSLLFFDEPSAGLDPVVSAELDQLILDLRAAMNVTIVVVTHELQSAFKIADRLIVLDQGNMIGVGTVDEIRALEDHRVQDLLNRRARPENMDVDDYLRRLTEQID